MSRPVFIINFKNYQEILGRRSLSFAAAAENVSQTLDVEIILAPPAPMLGSVVSSVRLPVFSQRVENGEQGKSTGSVIPESLKEAGCAGSLLNHSESRVSPESVSLIIARMRALQLATCVCAESPDELRRMALYTPEYLAIEPPELIGSGIAVSKARPELLQDSVGAAREAGYGGRLLCGAGITTGEDARAARKLGMDGILAASSVVKAKDWEAKVHELASALV